MRDGEPVLLKQACVMCLGYLIRTLFIWELATKIFATHCSNPFHAVMLQHFNINNLSGNVLLNKNGKEILGLSKTKILKTEKERREKFW